MPVDLEGLCEHLDAQGLKYTVSPRSGLVLLPFESSTVVVRIVEGGQGLQFAVNPVFNIGESDHLSACLAWIAEYPRTHKVGAFTYDPETGNVGLSYFFPVQDGELTAAQLNRLVRVMAYIAAHDVQELRRVAYGKPPRSIDEPRLSPGLAAELERLATSTPDRVEPSSLPEPPVDESAWLSSTLVAFHALCGRPEQEERVAVMRKEVWPQLLELRAASVAEGRRYRTVELAEQFGLDSPEEFLVLFLLARRATGIALVDAETIDRVYSPGLQSDETVALVAELRDRGVIEPGQGDNEARYRLTTAYLDPLAEVLPFEV